MPEMFIGPRFEPSDSELTGLEAASHPRFLLSCLDFRVHFLDLPLKRKSAFDCFGIQMESGINDVDGDDDNDNDNDGDDGDNVVDGESHRVEALRVKTAGLFYPLGDSFGITSKFWQRRVLILNLFGSVDASRSKPDQT